MPHDEAMELYAEDDAPCWLCEEPLTTLQPWMDTPCVCGAALWTHTGEHPHTREGCAGFLAHMPPRRCLKSDPERF